MHGATIKILKARFHLGLGMILLAVNMAERLIVVNMVIHFRVRSKPKLSEQNVLRETPYNNVSTRRRYSSPALCRYSVLT